MRRLRADLHVHTALSPCASGEMTPDAIVRVARERGIDVIAICDHNTAGNVDAVCGAAAGRPAVIAGAEITTREEVHVLGLFPDVPAASAAARRVLESLPLRGEDDDPFGQQLLLDAEGRVRGVEPRMLAAPSDLTLSAAVALIRGHGGLAVAAHVNRPAFSVPGQLAFFPPDVRFDAVELDCALPTVVRGRSLRLPRVSRLHSSDAHCTSAIGRCLTVLEVAAASFEELALAVCRRAGRGCSRA